MSKQTITENTKEERSTVLADITAIFVSRMAFFFFTLQVYLQITIYPESVCAQGKIRSHF